MNESGYLILAISIIVALAIIFVVSFVFYVRTPAPKGCENIKISEENCSSCDKKECRFYKEKETE